MSASLIDLQLRMAGCSDWPKCLHVAMLVSTSEAPDLRRSKEPVLNSLAAKRDLRISHKNNAEQRGSEDKSAEKPVRDGPSRGTFCVYHALASASSASA